MKEIKVLPRRTTIDLAYKSPSVFSTHETNIIAYVQHSILSLLVSDPARRHQSAQCRDGEVFSSTLE